MERKIVLLLAAVLVFGVAAYGHHSLAALYDESKSVKIDGKVVQFSFRSPHSFVAIEAPDDKGKVQRWAVTWSAAAALARSGITRDFFKIGDRIIITGNPGRNAEDHAIKMVTLSRPSDGFSWGTAAGERVD